MTIEEKFIYETSIRIEALKEALEIVKLYSPKEKIEAALEGAIQGNEFFLNNLKERVENEKRNIL